MSDCEMPTVCNHCTPRASKDHRCCECRGTIRAGETYDLIIGLWDGRWQTFKTCPECTSLRKVFEDEATDPGQSPGLGYLSEHIFDHYNGFTPARITRFLNILRARGATIPADWLKIEAEHGDKNVAAPIPLPAPSSTL